MLVLEVGYKPLTWLSQVETGSGEQNALTCLTALCSAMGTVMLADNLNNGFTFDMSVQDSRSFKLHMINAIMSVAEVMLVTHFQYTSRCLDTLPFIARIALMALLRSGRP